MAALCGFGGVLEAVTGLRELPGGLGWRRAPRCPTARARRQPLRGLSAGVLIEPVVK